MSRVTDAPGANLRERAHKIKLAVIIIVVFVTTSRRHSVDSEAGVAVQRLWHNRNGFDDFEPLWIETHILTISLNIGTGFKWSKSYFSWAAVRGGRWWTTAL